MTQFSICIVTFWLSAAIWMNMGGAEEVFWISLLPAAWLASLLLVKR